MRYEHTCTPIEVDGATITPIAEVRLHATRWSHGLYVWGSVEPIAVVIRREGREVRIVLENHRVSGVSASP